MSLEGDAGYKSKSEKCDNNNNNNNDSNNKISITSPVVEIIERLDKINGNDCTTTQKQNDSEESIESAEKKLESILTHVKHLQKSGKSKDGRVQMLCTNIAAETLKIITNPASGCGASSRNTKNRVYIHGKGSRGSYWDKDVGCTGTGTSERTIQRRARRLRASLEKMKETKKEGEMVVQRATKGLPDSKKQKVESDNEKKPTCTKNKKQKVENEKEPQQTKHQKSKK